MQKISRKDAIRRIANLSVGLSFGMVIADKAVAVSNSSEKLQNLPAVAQQSDVTKSAMPFRALYKSLCYDRCAYYDSGYSSTAGQQGYTKDYYCQKNSYFYCTTDRD